MATIQKFEDLICWQKARALANFIGCAGIPRSFATGIRGTNNSSGGAATSAKKPAPVPSVNTSELCLGDRRTDWFILFSKT